MPVGEGGGGLTGERLTLGDRRIPYPITNSSLHHKNKSDLF